MVQDTLMLEGVDNWLQNNDQSSNPKLGTMSATYCITSWYPYSFKAMYFLGFQGGCLAIHAIVVRQEEQVLKFECLILWCGLSRSICPIAVSNYFSAKTSMLFPLL